MMNGKIVFYTISSLLGVISAYEGIWFFGLFLLYLFVLTRLKKLSKNAIVLNVIFYLCYFIISGYTNIHNQTKLKPKGNQYNIQFLDEVKLDGNRFRAVAKEATTNEKLVIKYSIPSENEKHHLNHYPLFKKTCTVQGNLVEPKKARNLNAFDYQTYLKHHRIFWELQISSWEINKCKQLPISLIDRIKLFRMKGINIIEKNFSNETAPLAAALIFGSRDLLSEDTVVSYQKLGVIHLISISGLHVALLVGIFFYLCIRFGGSRERITWILLIIMPAYALLSGATPSVNRSVIMTMIVLSIRLMNIPKILSSIDGLCISLLILMLYDSQIIFDIGFQLTYVVTFSLLISKFIIDRFHTAIGKMVIISYISQISALPFLLYHFFEIPLFSIMANLIFIPLYSFVFLPALVLLFFLQFISLPLFNHLSFVISSLIDYSNHIASLISSFKWTSIIIGKPSHLLLIIYSASILSGFYLWEKKSRLLLAFSLPWFVMGMQLFIPTLSPKGEVSFIDVGQGDSIFIKLPFNQGNYLIDTGGSILFSEVEWKQKRNTFDVGSDILVPFLKSKGIRDLDLLILTHGDLDHIGGSLSLLKEIKVKKIVLPLVDMEKSSIEKEIITIANQNNTDITYVTEGTSWNVGENKFMVLSPEKKYNGDKNNGSIVLYAELGGLNWLFTGDLGIEGEKRIIERYSNLSIKVLKVGHHGSRNSSSKEFIQLLHPQYAILSVGEKNRFGHPHKEVLQVLKEEGSVILRTDKDGEITYNFHGKKGTFSKKLP